MKFLLKLGAVVNQKKGIISAMEVLFYNSGNKWCDRSQEIYEILVKNKAQQIVLPSPCFGKLRDLVIMREGKKKLKKIEKN